MFAGLAACGGGDSAAATLNVTVRLDFSPPLCCCCCCCAEDGAAEDAALLRFCGASVPPQSHRVDPIVSAPRARDELAGSIRVARGGERERAARVRVCVA